MKNVWLNTWCFDISFSWIRYLAGFSIGAENMGCFTFITVLDIFIFLGIIFCRGATLFDKWGGGSFLWVRGACVFVRWVGQGICFYESFFKKKSRNEEGTSPHSPNFRKPFLACMPELVYQHPKPSVYATALWA